MTHERRSDYIRSDELADALIPIDQLPLIFGVDARTIRRWIKADGITTHPYGASKFGDPHGKAVRFGDIPEESSETTRWKRQIVSGRN